MLFVDASALVKRYARERHSVKARRLLTAAPIAISRLSEVEVPSALARLVRDTSGRTKPGGLSRSMYPSSTPQTPLGRL
jgi:predicted nucleic acid-binding protein